MKPITIVGILDNGCKSLSSYAWEKIIHSQILVGGERHLSFFPDYQGRKIPIKNGLTKVLEEIEKEHYENNICVLASGDPLFFGIASILIKKFGLNNIEIIPNLSVAQLAFSKIGLKWDDATFLSVHGKSLFGISTKLLKTNKAILLTDPDNTPQKIAKYLLEYNHSEWKIWVCENLYGINERILEFDLPSLASSNEKFSDLNVLVFYKEKKNPVLINFHEDQYAKRTPLKGLITKKEIRALSIMQMNLKDNSCIWDIGAASGSIAIESAYISHNGKAYAIEMDEESIEYCKENLKHHSIDNVIVIHGRAPEILKDISDDPDSIFIGGSKGSLIEIIEYSYSRLKPEGRMIINAITFENIVDTYQYLKNHNIDFDVMQVSINRGVPLAKYKRYEAQNPIHIFTIYKGKEK
ncbi:MAG: precorrin-6Y C5,15-methyltransferase [Leptospiraceae bacterium]|nr:MAG: precorrin-6Y C5,15-methyltransferase [Leptospiraceae bacterium]